MDTDVFRICHVSDLHLSSVCPEWINRVSARDANEGVFCASLKQVMNFCHQKFRGCGVPDIHYPSTYVQLATQTLPRLLRRLDQDDTESHLDLVLITGDLATTGEDADLLFALDFLEGRVLAVADTPEIMPINLVAEPFTLFAIPGNHDRYRGTGRFPEGKNFEAFFGQSWDINQKKTKIVGDRTRRFIVSGESCNLAILGVDFSLSASSAECGIWGHFGQGEVDEERLRSLVDATEILQQEYKKPHIVIWAMHFPPESPNKDPDLQLFGADRVILEAERLGVQLILSGHVHQHHYRKRGTSRVHVLVAGSATATEKVGDNVLHDLQIVVEDGRIATNKLLIRDGIFDVDNRRWDLSSWRSFDAPITGEGENVGNTTPNI